MSSDDDASLINNAREEGLYDRARVASSSSGGVGESVAPNIGYVCVARGERILAEHRLDANYDLGDTLFRILRALNPDEELRKSYTHGKHMVNIRVVDGLTFVCITRSDFSVSLTFQMLSACANVFRANHGHGRDVADLAPGALNGSYTPKCLAPKVAEFNAQDLKRSRVQQITSKVDDVRDIMFDNMKTVLQRGDKLEVIEHKTEVFSETAEDLHRNASIAAKNAEMRLWRMKVWSWCTFIFIVLFLLIAGGGYLALALVCNDWTLVEKCFYNGHPPSNVTQA